MSESRSRKRSKGELSNISQVALDAKLDDSQVLTNVPSGSLFTDTVYSKPSSEPISYISALQTTLDNKLSLVGGPLTGAITINNKNVPKVFNQTTAPTSGFVVGDIWYDDDDDILSMAGNIAGSLQWIGV